MNRFFTSILFIAILASFTQDRNELYPVLKNSSFSKGELLVYEMSFGIFSVGTATTKVDPKVYTMNGRPCYKIDGFGATSGWVSWISKVDDNWGAYIDTAALVTHVSYRKLKEGRYRKDEEVTFDHENQTAEVKVKDKKTGVWEPSKTFPTHGNVRDLVAGFIYLRVIDFGKYRKGDTVTISGFFEDKAYKMKILYEGKERIHTKLGKMKCHKLVPIVPDNKLFDGPNSITAWLSADRNQIPIKIQAKMFIGSAGLELEQFGGLRNPLEVTR
jgi:Protein of unknown function (DUF3108)